MASTSATLITSIPNFSSIGQRYDSSGCGVLSERWRTMYNSCQSFRARVCTECVNSLCCSVVQRSLSRNPSVTDMRRSRKAVVARASFQVAYEFEDAFGALSLPLPPEPVLFPRKMLNLKFAVLLMRSAYEAVDALDFIPMDKFQIKFWKLRQSELEPYTLQYRPLRVKYGDLTDPEKVGSDGESRTVRRDERLKDNATLPAAFINKAGDLLYEKLVDGFENEVFDAPPPASSDFLTVSDGVKKLVQVFVDKGYALKASVEPVQFSATKPGGKLRVRLEGSATQWGVRALASRRALLLNDFAALAIGSYLRACGFSASPKVRYTDTSAEQLWTIV